MILTMYNVLIIVTLQRGNHNSNYMSRGDGMDSVGWILGLLSMQNFLPESFRQVNWLIIQNHRHKRNESIIPPSI